MHNTRKRKTTERTTGKRRERKKEEEKAKKKKKEARKKRNKKQQRQNVCLRRDITTQNVCVTAWTRLQENVITDEEARCTEMRKTHTKSGLRF